MDTANKYLVSVQGDHLVLLNPPGRYEPITKEEALVLSAHLVALAETDSGQFDAVLRAVVDA